jgi:hypothetical protein
MSDGAVHAVAGAQLYFPNVYDIKYLMKFCGNLHGGLSKLAETLKVRCSWWPINLTFISPGGQIDVLSLCTLDYTMEWE